MCIGHADARRAHILDADAHAFDLARRHLVERQRIALEHAAFRIDEQQRQIVLLEKLTDFLAQFAQVVNGILMLLLQIGKLILCHLARHVHRLRANAKLPALEPRFCHPGMHVRVKHSLFDKFLIVAFQLAPAAMFPDHKNPSNSFIRTTNGLLCEISYLLF